MAVTLTAAELVEAIGVEAPKATRLLPVVTELVTRYAPDAPAEIANEAAIRAAGWLHEQPKASIRGESAGPFTVNYMPSMSSALRNSGATALLAPWRVRRAGSNRLMRWPWQKRPERRDIGGSGNFSDQVIRLIESQAATKAADAGSTAAVEAAAGALSRAFASAEVEAAPWVQEIVTPDFLALTARNWIRSGASMHVIEVDRGGRVELLPGAFWNFEGGARRRDWSIRVTSYGPSSSETRLVPFDAIIFTTWGTSPGTPYVGTGPLGWASTTARLQSEAESDPWQTRRPDRWRNS